jgi:predicted Zn finger-like uncharacterized protein
MKITCQACAAKYTIADEKVLGKIVKIRCKKCGATIVVNGNDPSASAGSAGAEPPRAFDYASQGAQADGWTVNVADGDQRTMTDGEIVGGYHGGWVTDETFCWKDGMTDWLPLREIEQLYAACTATRAMEPAGMLPDQGITKIDQTPGLFGGSPAPAPAAYAAPRPAAGAAALPGNGGLASTAAAAPAARRAAGRAPAADLFSGAAQAGGEDDVMTSAPAGMPQVHDDPQKLTGARNENSVLFSLSALTSKPGGSNRPPAPTQEASGLIDIRNLGAQIGLGEDKKKSRIDDIMNLAGGGAFSPALNAPVLQPPPVEEYAPPPDIAAEIGRAAVAPPKSKAIIFGAVFAGVVVVAGAIGAALFFMGKSDEDKAAASASAASTSPAPSASMAMNTSGAPADTTASGGTAPPPDSATANTASTTPTSATTKPTATTAKTAATTTTATAAATKDTPPAATKDTPPAATTAAAAAGADQPFNMGEAKARLASIAGGVQGCKKGDLSGSGRVVVTFAPSGNAQSAVVSGAPFEGTPTGACVAGRFRGARVPPFSGSPFSVSKSFTIN